jgi:hypothetical protein
MQQEMEQILSKCRTFKFSKVNFIEDIEASLDTMVKIKLIES